MHPYIHAQNTPDRPAFIMASTDEVVTYKQLNDRSNQRQQPRAEHAHAVASDGQRS